jgi:hypothetical protein
MCTLFTIILLTKYVYTFYNNIINKCVRILPNNIIDPNFTQQKNQTWVHGPTNDYQKCLFVGVITLVTIFANQNHCQTIWDELRK